MTFIERIVANISDVTKSVAFIGSGLSVKAGMKDWDNSMRDFIELCKTLGRDSAEIQFYELLHKKAQYLKMMDIAYDQLGNVQYLNLLDKIFRKDIKCTEEHYQLVKIPFAGFITTNFDKLIELAYTKEYNKTLYTKTHTTDDIKRLLSWNNEFLFKIHGDIDNIDEIVIKKRDADNILERTDIRDLILKYLLSYQFIFIGYSWRDPDFQVLWQLINSTSKLREPGILITQKGKFDVDAINRLKDININHFEPDLIDEDDLPPVCVPMIS